MHTHKNHTHAEAAAIAANRLYNQLKAAEPLAKQLFHHSVNTRGDINDIELNTETLEKLRRVRELAKRIHNAAQTARSNYEYSTHVWDVESMRKVAAE